MPNRLKNRSRTEENRKDPKRTERNRKEPKRTEKNRKEPKRTERNRKEPKGTERDRIIVLLSQKEFKFCKNSQKKQKRFLQNKNRTDRTKFMIQTKK